MCKAERHAGVGTVAVEGNLGEERNESVKSKDRVYVPEWIAIRKMQSGQLPRRLPNSNILEALFRAMEACTQK